MIRHVIAKALLAGAMIAEIPRRLPTGAALVGSLPLGAGVALKSSLYLAMDHLGPRLGLRL